MLLCVKGLSAKIIIILIAIITVSCINPRATPRIIFKNPVEKIELKSRAFTDGGDIPRRYTCYEDNISPPLFWKNAPKNTKSFVIMMEDPDAFIINAVHWIIFNIPGNTTEMEEGVISASWLPNDAIHGKNSFRTVGYKGPCPKLRTHTYTFTIYALNRMLPKEIGISRSALIDTIKNDIIGYGVLKGKY